MLGDSDLDRGALRAFEVCASTTQRNVLSRGEASGMVTTDELRRNPLFAALSEAGLTRVSARAADIRVNAGEWVVHEGDPTYLWAVLEGEVEALRFLGGELMQTTTFDPDEFFGETPMMLGAPMFSAIRALRPTRLARIDPNDFHAMIEDSPAAAALLSQTLSRRVGLIGGMYAESPATQVTIVGDRYDFACHDIRDFLSRNAIAYEWLDPSEAPDRPFIPQAVLASAVYPAVAFADGSFVTLPDARTLATRVGLQTEPASESYDVVIIGGGPSGLAAAVYGGSEGLHSIMIEREAPGGQAGTSSRIENYLGFPGGISGGDLAHRALKQAKRFGTELLVTRSVEAIESYGNGHIVRLDGHANVRTRAIVLATGVTWRKLEADGASEFIGRGVYYGAARTEALGTHGRDIFLIGGGNSAGQAAMFFANYARSVTILIRGDSLAKSMSFYLIEQLRSKTNIAIESRSIVTAVRGATHVEEIDVTRVDTGAVAARRADGVFTFIGADADTKWLPAEIERDARGYIVTGRELETWSLARAPYHLETSVPGIFASGDVRSCSVKRVASSVGEGSMVISFIHSYLATLPAADTVHAE